MSGAGLGLPSPEHAESHPAVPAHDGPRDGGLRLRQRAEATVPGRAAPAQPHPGVATFWGIRLGSCSGGGSAAAEVVGQSARGCDVLFHEILVRHPQPELRLDEEKDLQQRHRVDARGFERVVGPDRMTAGHDVGVDEGRQDLGDVFGIDPAERRRAHCRERVVVHTPPGRRGLEVARILLAISGRHYSLGYTRSIPRGAQVTCYRAGALRDVRSAKRPRREGGVEYGDPRPSSSKSDAYLFALRRCLSERRLRARDRRDAASSTRWASNSFTSRFPTFRRPTSVARFRPVGAESPASQCATAGALTPASRATAIWLSPRRFLRL